MDDVSLIFNMLVPNYIIYKAAFVIFMLQTYNSLGLHLFMKI